LIIRKTETTIFNFRVLLLYIFIPLNRIKMATTINTKKFGTLPVFFTAISTILGAILFLRFGYAVGTIGFWGVIGIVILGHMVTIPTALAISELATNKRVEGGGEYFIISRSFGLNIGATIGIALYLSQAISVAFYVIAFTESFQFFFDYVLSNYGYDLPRQAISIPAIIILGAVILYKGANLGVKALYFVVAILFFAIIMFFLGSGPETTETTVSLFDNGVFDSSNFFIVFAIIFPAFTGMTAGVGLSGDLKNPKKDIPRGTLLSISVGLIVYVALAITFYFFVDQQLLIDDYNVIMALAWIPALVIAGLWGATLSSALGGILGGPRIIQAIAQDKIVPKILGKGYGVNNEPRNALIFTFLISEIGILIGDLNIIAGVVTMFYLTAYGFINLAFALEKWASTDFRPSFKISLWVGIIGFFASFFIMFQLDVISMFGALAILGVVYHLISRKQLNLEFGDVWQSVGSSVLRKLLTMLSKSNDNIRNWRPNILLFSGGTSSRPYLIEFGKSFVGNYGLISNFILVLNKTSKVLFPKHKQALTKDDDFETEGVFTRLQECNNIYKGIESISATYGFSGVEPNTVILGWGRETEDPYGLP